MTLFKQLLKQYLTSWHFQTERTVPDELAKLIFVGDF